MICEECTGRGYVTHTYIEGRSRDFTCTKCVGTGRIDEISFSLAEAGTIKRCLSGFELDALTEKFMREEAERDQLEDVEAFLERCKKIGVIQ